MGHVLPLSSLPLSVLWLLPQEGAGAAGLCAVSRLQPSQCCCHFQAEYQLWLCIALKVNQALKSAFPLFCGSESCEARS